MAINIFFPFPSSPLFSIDPAVSHWRNVTLCKQHEKKKRPTTPVTDQWRMLQDERKKRKKPCLSRCLSQYRICSLRSTRIHVCVCVYDKRINVPCDVRAWIKNKRKEERKRGRKVTTTMFKKKIITKLQERRTGGWSSNPRGSTRGRGSMKKPEPLWQRSGRSRVSGKTKAISLFQTLINYSPRSEGCN